MIGMNLYKKKNETLGLQPLALTAHKFISTLIRKSSNMKEIDKKVLNILGNLLLKHYQNEKCALKRFCLGLATDTKYVGEMVSFAVIIYYFYAILQYIC